MAKWLFKLAVALTLVLVLPAQALALRYAIGAYDKKASNESYAEGDERRYYWTGTSTYNYVMKSPPITFRHINSIYLRRPVFTENVTGNVYELGWAWNVDKPKPHWFRVIIEGGRFITPKSGQTLVDPAQPDNINALWVYSANGRIVFRIDNVQNTWYRDNPAMLEGWSVWASERENKDENNYAHFWALGKKNHAGGWNGWQNHEMFSMSDHPDYHLYRRGENEGWSHYKLPALDATHQY